MTPNKLPVVVASSVIRSSQQGNSHGGVYLVDLDDGTPEQMLDWDNVDIDWSGRGGDRGLRGIAFYDSYLVLAASNEIFVFDSDFSLRDSYTGPFLRHCHEIFVEGATLYLTSTGFDSILEFDLKRGEFGAGHQFEPPAPIMRLRESGVPAPPRLAGGIPLVPRVRTFDASAAGADVSEHDFFHLNSVWRRGGATYVAGTGTRALLRLDNTDLRRHAWLPRGTHNARPLDDLVAFNHTRTDSIRLKSRWGGTRRSWSVPQYGERSLDNTEIPNDHARQGFGRGLASHGETLLIGGSSPATISVYDLRSPTSKPMKSVNLTRDIRNAVHGLAVWPFS